MDEVTSLASEKKCTSCGNMMSSYDTVSLRKGGVQDFLTDISEVFVEQSKTNCYKCSKCGHIDFYQV